MNVNGGDFHRYISSVAIGDVLPNRVRTLVLDTETRIDLCIALMLEFDTEAALAYDVKNDEYIGLFTIHDLLKIIAFAIINHHILQRKLKTYFFVCEYIQDRLCDLIENPSQVLDKGYYLPLMNITNLCKNEYNDTESTLKDIHFASGSSPKNVNSSKNISSDNFIHKIIKSGVESNIISSKYNVENTFNWGEETVNKTENNANIINSTSVRSRNRANPRKNSTRFILKSDLEKIKLLDLASLDINEKKCYDNCNRNINTKEKISKDIISNEKENLKKIKSTDKLSLLFNKQNTDLESIENQNVHSSSTLKILSKIQSNCFIKKFRFNDNQDLVGSKTDSLSNKITKSESLHNEVEDLFFTNISNNSNDIKKIQLKNSDDSTSNMSEPNEHVSHKYNCDSDSVGLFKISPCETILRVRSSRVENKRPTSFDKKKSNILNKDNIFRDNTNSIRILYNDDIDENPSLVDSNIPNMKNVSPRYISSFISCNSSRQNSPFCKNNSLFDTSFNDQLFDFRKRLKKTIKHKEQNKKKKDLSVKNEFINNCAIADKNIHLQINQYRKYPAPRFSCSCLAIDIKSDVYLTAKLSSSGISYYTPVFSFENEKQQGCVIAFRSKCKEDQSNNEIPSFQTENILEHIENIRNTNQVIDSQINYLDTLIKNENGEPNTEIKNDIKTIFSVNKTIKKRKKLNFDRNNRSFIYSHSVPIKFKNRYQYKPNGIQINQNIRSKSDSYNPKIKTNGNNQLTNLIDKKSEIYNTYINNEFTFLIKTIKNPENRNWLIHEFLVDLIDKETEYNSLLKPLHNILAIESLTLSKEVKNILLEKQSKAINSLIIILRFLTESDNSVINMIKNYINKSNQLSNLIQIIENKNSIDDVSENLESLRNYENDTSLVNLNDKPFWYDSILTESSNISPLKSSFNFEYKKIAVSCSIVNLSNMNDYKPKLTDSSPLYFPYHDLDIAIPIKPQGSFNLKTNDILYLPLLRNDSSDSSTSSKDSDDISIISSSTKKYEPSKVSNFTRYEHPNYELGSWYEEKPKNINTRSKCSTKIFDTSTQNTKRNNICISENNTESDLNLKDVCDNIIMDIDLFDDLSIANSSPKSIKSNNKSRRLSRGSFSNESKITKRNKKISNKTNPKITSKYVDVLTYITCDNPGCNKHGKSIVPVIYSKNIDFNSPYLSVSSVVCPKGCLLGIQKSFTKNISLTTDDISEYEEVLQSNPVIGCKHGYVYSGINSGFRDFSESTVLKELIDINELVFSPRKDFSKNGTVLGSILSPIDILAVLVDMFCGERLQNLLQKLVIQDLDIAIKEKVEDYTNIPIGCAIAYMGLYKRKAMIWKGADSNFHLVTSSEVFAIVDLLLSSPANEFEMDLSQSVQEFALRWENHMLLLGSSCPINDPAKTAKHAIMYQKDATLNGVLSRILLTNTSHVYLVSDENPDYAYTKNTVQCVKKHCSWILHQQCVGISSEYTKGLSTKSLELLFSQFICPICRFHEMDPRLPVIGQRRIDYSLLDKKKRLKLLEHEKSNLTKQKYYPTFFAVSKSKTHKVPVHFLEEYSPSILALGRTNNQSTMRLDLDMDELEIWKKKKYEIFIRCIKLDYWSNDKINTTESINNKNVELNHIDYCESQNSEVKTNSINPDSDIKFKNSLKLNNILFRNDHPINININNDEPKSWGYKLTPQIWPHSLRARINLSVQFHITPADYLKMRRDLPVNITTVMHSGNNRIDLVLEDSNPSQYMIAVCICSSCSTPLWQSIILHNKLNRPFIEVALSDYFNSIALEECIERYDEDDITVVSDIKLRSKICPISQEVLRLPARSIRCRHIQCIELEILLKSRTVSLSGSYRCPLCQAYAPYQDLYIDWFCFCSVHGISLLELQKHTILLNDIRLALEDIDTENPDYSCILNQSEELFCTDLLEKADNYSFSVSSNFSVIEELTDDSN